MTNKRSSEEKTKRDRSGTPRWVTAVGAVVLLAVIAVLTIGFMGGGQAPDTGRMPGTASPDRSSPSGRADIRVPEGVEFFENEGQNHVREGVRVSYKTDPPTSGSHYDRWAPASVYEAGEVAPELLVHNLEHGNIVIYFDRSRLTQPEVDALIELQKKHIGQWDGVLLVAREDQLNPIVLTAWRTILRLEGYDRNKVSEFVDTFRGRGPENPVR